MFELSPPAAGENQWTETILYRFTGPDGCAPGGFMPVAGLVFDRLGNLYGTTYYGGHHGGCDGYGTVFELSPPAKGETGWTKTTIHQFTGLSLTGQSDGGNPDVGSLVIDREGNLYGTTVYGGIDCNGSGDGCGTVFELSPPSAGETAWTEAILYSFNGGSSDGISPAGGLIRDRKGNFYGTSAAGGIAAACPANQLNHGCGTVFELSPPAGGGSNWAEAVLHIFSGRDGAYPGIGLTFDATGNLYGVTEGGANQGCFNNGNYDGCGTVFEVTRPGTASGLGFTSIRR